MTVTEPAGGFIEDNGPFRKPEADYETTLEADLEAQGLRMFTRTIQDQHFAVVLTDEEEDPVGNAIENHPNARASAINELNAKAMAYFAHVVEVLHPQTDAKKVEELNEKIARERKGE